MHEGSPSPYRRPPALADVARLAGVSKTTASRAVSGKGALSDATRERVRIAAQQLGFVPSALAQSLFAGESRTVGVVTSDLEGRFVLPVVRGAENALGLGEVNVLLCDARGEPDREARHIDELIKRRVDGIIVVGDTTNARPSLGRLPVPVVYAYSPSDDPGDASVVPDNVQGGRLAAEHLLLLGRTRLAVVTGEDSFLAAHDRIAGVLEVLDAAGLAPQGPPLFGEWSERWGRNGAAEVMRRHPDTDAIVCGSDHIARGVLDELHECGLRVPDTIAVIGYDNWSVLAAHSSPELTTVDCNLESIGAQAARRVFTRIRQSDAAQGTDHVGPSLIIRSSSVLRAR